jgi:hypothetical protein
MRCALAFILLALSACAPMPPATYTEGQPLQITVTTVFNPQTGQHTWANLYMNGHPVAYGAADGQLSGDFAGRRAHATCKQTRHEMKLEYFSSARRSGFPVTVDCDVFLDGTSRGKVRGQPSGAAPGMPPGYVPSR